MKLTFRKFANIVAIAIMLGAPFTPNLSAIVSAQGHSKVVTQDVRKVNKQIIHIKFEANANVSLHNGEFSANDSVQATKLNAILASAKKVKIEQLAPKQAGSHSNSIDTALQNYYQVRLATDADVMSLTTQLHSLSIVEEAYAQPLPAPKPTANYTGLQSYLGAAPSGVGAWYGYYFPGGTGSNANIVDIEYSWNTSHEDLPKSKMTVIANGTPSDPFNNNNHGTAAVGEMLASNNGYGVTGVSAGSSVALVNATNTEHGWDVTNALKIAAWVTKPGDVILVEQQTYGPTSDQNNYVPVEWIPEIYDGIKWLTSNGRIVVEPAGNGSQNLDDQTYFGSSFPAGKPDSGAIIVGAGEACNSQAARSRLSFSTYGSRVNVQGPGNCVATTGYGDLNFVAGVNGYYTQYFSGTSSATPIIAATAVDISSTYKAFNGGSTLTSAQVRDILMNTGTAQNTTPGYLSGNIGPLPNLAQAFLKTDKTAPSVPINLKAVLNANKKPVISWNVSSDNYYVSAYLIYRNGSLYSYNNNPSFTDNNAVTGQTYSYSVSAMDPSGNESARSVPVSITVH